MRAHAVKGGDLQKKNAPVKNARSGEGVSGAENALQRMSEDSASALQLQELSDLASSAGSIAEIAALQDGMGADTPMQRAAMEEEPAQGKFKPGADAVQRAAMEEEPAQGKFKPGADAVQRAAMEEEPAQGKFKPGADAVQRAAMEEEPAQGKFTGSPAGTVQRKSGSGGDGKLPGTLQSGVESLSGQSMNDVKVHYNSPEPRQMEAHAFAQGSDIHVASGQEKHLPHEAWHVAQQKQGRVKPTTSMNGGVPVNDDPGLEREADVMGAKSLSKGAETAQKKDMEE
jgi:hypothetical protein